MSIYIGNNLEDRLKALEMEKASLKNTMITVEWCMKLMIRHTSKHVDSSFYKQSLKIDNYAKI